MRRRYASLCPATPTGHPAPARSWLTGVLVLLSCFAAPGAAHACACGCGIFEVGTASMFPTRSGGTLSLEYDFMNQDDNWSGTSSASAADNEDKQIRTTFVTAKLQYMLDRAWGVSVDVPYWHRQFRTADDGGVSEFTHGAPGDVRVRALYTGISDDLSTGLTAGLKLPTGDHAYANFDRDTQIGTGSTDAILGAHHIGPLTPDRAWVWFVDGMWDLPFAYSGAYRPGNEVDVTAAVASAGYRVGGWTVAPLVATVGTVRARDSGAEASPGDTGYQRVLLAPGIDARLGSVRVTGLVDVPVHQHVNGNQLVAPAFFRLTVGHSF